MDSDASVRPLGADTRELVGLIVDALLDKKAEDVVVLNIGAVSTLADVFVIASGTSTRHIATLVDSVRERAKVEGHRPLGVEGEGTTWALIDFADTVVHIFDRQTRDFYDLERLWLDAPRLDPADVPVPAAS